jgi:hypothetical protein
VTCCAVRDGSRCSDSGGGGADGVLENAETNDMLEVPTTGIDAFEIKTADLMDGGGAMWLELRVAVRPADADMAILAAGVLEVGIARGGDPAAIILQQDTNTSWSGITVEFTGTATLRVRIANATGSPVFANASCFYKWQTVTPGLGMPPPPPS